jgi:hypothetical protein
MSPVVVGELASPPPRPRDVRPVLFSVDVSLRPWTNYTFRVAGRNALGVGPFGRPTEPGACSTPATKPYRNPTGICSNLTTSRGHLNVLWQVGCHTACLRQHAFEETLRRTGISRCAHRREQIIDVLVSGSPDNHFRQGSGSITIKR